MVSCIGGANEDKDEVQCSCQKVLLSDAFKSGHHIFLLEVKFRCPFLESWGGRVSGFEDSKQE